MNTKIYKAVKIVFVVAIMKLLPSVRLLIFLTFVLLSIKKSVNIVYRCSFHKGHYTGIFNLFNAFIKMYLF
jgi:hypothetical protein